MPNGLEYEKALLGAILGSPLVVEDLGLSPELFENIAYRHIFDAIADVKAHGLKPDTIAISDSLRLAGNEGDLSTLASIEPGSAANARYYRDRLADLAARRALRPVLVDALKATSDEAAPLADTVATLEKALVSSTLGRPEEDDPTAAALMPAYLHGLEDRYKEQRDGTALVVNTGIPALDSLLGPVRPGELLVIAARPSCGKSAMLLQLAAHTAIDLLIPSAVFSMEMSRVENTDRLIAQRSAFTIDRLRNGQLREDELAALIEIGSEIAAAPLAFYDGRHDLAVLLSRMRRERLTRKARVFLIDYLGLIDLKTQREAQVWEKTAEITRALKLEAIESRVVVVVACQLNREADGREPTLGQLRGSGSVEQDADRVLLAYRADSAAPVVSWNLAKNRHGRTGKVELRFNGAHARFE